MFGANTCYYLVEYWTSMELLVILTRSKVQNISESQRVPETYVLHKTETYFFLQNTIAHQQMPQASGYKRQTSLKHKFLLDHPLQ